MSNVYETTVNVVACQYDGTGDSLQPVLHFQPNLGQYVADVIDAGLLVPSNWLVLHADTTVGICLDKDFRDRYRKK